MLTGVEYLPATGPGSGNSPAGEAHELVLLHGWGGNREVWRGLLANLRPRANVTLLDIPGLAPGLSRGDREAPVTLDETLQAILAGSPARAVFAGFSLGGQLALELAARAPERVAAVVTIGSNPRFVATPDWPGMAALDFAAFRAGAAAAPAGTLKRFDSLQVAGSVRARELRRELRGHRRATGCWARAGCGALPLEGLDWLGRLDQRGLVARLDQPQLHLLSRHDALVPAALAGALDSLAAGNPRCAVRVLPGDCHLAPLVTPGGVAGALDDFLAALPGRGSGDGEPRGGDDGADPDVSREELAASFSRAASRYDSVARLQREVGAHLLSSLDQLAIRPHRVLDLGCGTGYFAAGLLRRFPAADYIGLDIAAGMVDYARRRCAGTGEWLVADAESLPLARESVDLVFSSLALQWCPRPRHLFAELARVLRPGGVCVFTSLGPGTLAELRAAWAAVDSHRHVNRFLPAGELHRAAGAVPGIRLDLDARVFSMHYDRVRDLLDELKTLGAHNMNRGRPGGLTGRRALQGMLAAYESRRRDGRLPATWEVYFGALEKV